MTFQTTPITETITVNPGDVWRGRLIVSGPNAFAPATLVATTLKVHTGAEKVWVYALAGHKDFPQDWPANKLEDMAQDFERQWFVQMQFAPHEFPNQSHFTTVGDNWRIHDAWLHAQGTGIQPPEEPPEEPEIEPPEIEPEIEPPEEIIVAGRLSLPPGADVGNYAGRPKQDLDVWAKNVLIAAYIDVLNELPTPQAIQIIQAVGRVEGYYGWASKPPQWAGNHNWGAITCKCPCGFQATDGYLVDGKWTPYTTCFASRSTNLDGARHLIEVLIDKRPAVKAVINDANITTFARAMRDTTYFCRTTGKGKDGKPSCAAATDTQKQADADRYAIALDKACDAIGKKQGTGKLNFIAGQRPPTETPESKEPSQTYSQAGTIAAITLVGVGAFAMLISTLTRKSNGL
jgi:hypothetical protein